MAKEGMSPASTKQHLLAGLSAGTITAASLYPIDLVKTRYQVYDKSGNAYRSLLGAFQTIVKEEGVRGLFQGLGPAVMASAVSWGGYLYFYEHAKKRKLGHDGGSGSGGNSVQPSLGTVDHLLAGVEAGSCMVMITNPLWLLKTRLQIQHSPLPGAAAEECGTPRYKGPIDAVRVIFKEEGILGFYRGLLPALFLTSHGAVQFAVYEQLKSSFKTSGFQNKKDVHNQPAMVSMATGVLSKMVASTLTYPYQVIKSRLQQRGDLLEVKTSSGAVEMVPQNKYKGIFDCAKQIWRHEGLKGFFRGLVPNCIKVAPSAAVTFLVYEETLKLLTQFDICRI